LAAPALAAAGAGRVVMDQAAYVAIRSALGVVGAMPVEETRVAAAGLARVYAGMPFNRKRVKRAEANLRVAYPEASQEWVRDLAVRSHEHLFVLATDLIKAPQLLTDDSWHRHLTLGPIDGVVRGLLSSKPCLLLTGHCGNWELTGYTLALLGFPLHALYRPLDLEPMDRWVRWTRERRGLILLDKFGALRRLPPLVGSGTPVGFVADQSGGDRGMFVPYFNRLASTYKSIGLLAMQFGATIACAMARRCGPGEGGPGSLGYRLELDDCFGPEDWSTHPDPLFYLTARYRRSMERMVRRAPEQYLWMHRIWRCRPRHERLDKPFPEALEEKIRLLPWITEADLEAIKGHSARDARTLAETGSDRLS
jgi:Kdo2-lipid IVA lauroyltransferase/acyltransferase